MDGRQLVCAQSRRFQASWFCQFRVQGWASCRGTESDTLGVGLVASIHGSGLCDSGSEGRGVGELRGSGSRPVRRVSRRTGIGCRVSPV